MTRTDIINAIIQRYKLKRFLEIGVQDANNLNGVNCEYKVGVDPAGGQATHHMLSDTFFETNQETFDICFIDGGHTEEQVRRDTLNCLKILELGGFILLHDLNPQVEEHQNVYVNGTCWRAFVELRRERDDLNFAVVEADHGVGIIQIGKQNKLEIEGEVTWEGFAKNRYKWLNLISVSLFQRNYLV